MFERLKERFSEQMVMEYKEAPYTPKPRKTTRNKHTEQAVLDYLKANDGDIVRLEEVAEALNISGPYASMMITKLRNSKAITRKGKRGYYTYRINRQKAKKGAPRSRKVSSAKREVAIERVAQLRALTDPTKMSALERHKQALLRYLSQHQNEFFSQSEIAKATGMSQTSASFGIRSLEKEGALSRSLPLHGLGTKYMVNAVVSPNHPAKNLPSESVPVRKDSYEETLIREFLEYWKSRKG